MATSLILIIFYLIVCAVIAEKKNISFVNLKIIKCIHIYDSKWPFAFLFYVRFISAIRRTCISIYFISMWILLNKTIKFKKYLTKRAQNRNLWLKKKYCIHYNLHRVPFKIFFLIINGETSIKIKCKKVLLSLLCGLNSRVQWNYVSEHFLLKFYLNIMFIYCWCLKWMG